MLQTSLSLFISPIYLFAKIMVLSLESRLPHWSLPSYKATLELQTRVAFHNVGGLLGF